MKSIHLPDLKDDYVEVQVFLVVFSEQCIHDIDIFGSLNLSFSLKRLEQCFYLIKINSSFSLKLVRVME